MPSKAGMWDVASCKKLSRESLGVRLLQCTLGDLAINWALLLEFNTLFNSK